VAVLQIGLTFGGDGVTSVVYGCDGCEAKTGDMYARIAWYRRLDDGEWDDSEIEGWTFSEGYCYCPACVRENLRDEEPPEERPVG
jgi:hypothetical protein